MTNEEIDVRLKALGEAIPKYAEMLTKVRYQVEPNKNGYSDMEDAPQIIARELELLNMSMMAVFAMLGEIAKRLPEKS